MSSLRARHYRQTVEIQASVYMHSTECFWQCVPSKGVDEWDPKARLFVEKIWKGLVSIQAKRWPSFPIIECIHGWAYLKTQRKKKVSALWPDFSSSLFPSILSEEVFWSRKRLPFNVCPRCWLVSIRWSQSIPVLLSTSASGGCFSGL